MDREIIERFESDENMFINYYLVSCPHEDDENITGRNCYKCSHQKECLDEAIDIRDSCNLFQDTILSCGYDSMDDFYESNM
jgi:hypothetical protein